MSFKTPIFSGKGCSATTTAFLATENAFTFTFSRFFAEKGPDLPFKNNFSDCRIKLGVFIPSGYQARITHIDFRGFTDLDRQTTSFLVTYFRFGSQQWGSSPAKYFQGPNQVDFFKRDKPIFEKRGRCDVNRWVSLEILAYLGTLGDRKLSGVIQLDSADGLLEGKLALTPCL